MTNSPVPVLSIIAAYLYFVKSLGPKLMKKREPFNLRKVMLVYNAVQVVWCGFILKEVRAAQTNVFRIQNFS